jgi:hypothetical protein
MKKTLITAATFAACAAMQLPAQNIKEGAITFSMTEYMQTSVSAVKGTKDGGVWSAEPQYYTDGSAKLTTANILQSISYVLHTRNPNFYSSKATLVLSQPELGGFFNMTDPGLPEARMIQDTTDYDVGIFDSTGDAGDYSLTPVQDGALFASLATGRHLLPNPINGLWPPGHHQPWGQIFVKDPGKAGYSATDPLCENVTFFFAITVEECYDCYYLNSFISQATFTYKAGSITGVPCCGVPENLLGSGTDKYYMSLTFDNTSNNPYLNTNSVAWIGKSDISANYSNAVVGIDYLVKNAPANLWVPNNEGITPDDLAYFDPIASGLSTHRPPSPYELRFTLQGIVTYSWNLKLLNKGDTFADFVGTANYDARGYGFIALACGLLTGGVGNAMSIAETIKAPANCCQNDPWYDSWFGIGWNGPGPVPVIDPVLKSITLLAGPVQDPWGTDSSGITSLTGFGTILGSTVAGFGSPINTPADLSFHTSFDQNYYPGWEWQTNPTYDLVVPTINGTDSLNVTNTFVPIWSQPVTNSTPSE